MAEPIYLNMLGDALSAFPPGHNMSGVANPEWTTEEWDAMVMQNCVGIHATCRGWMDIRRTSAYNHTITCRECFLRIPVASHIKTFGDLRRAADADIYRNGH